MEVFVRSSGRWIPSNGGGRQESRMAELEEAIRQAHQRLRTVIRIAEYASLPGASYGMLGGSVLKLPTQPKKANVSGRLNYYVSLGDLHFANLRVEGGQTSYAGQVLARWINGQRAPDPEEIVHLSGANFSSLTFAHVDLQVRQSAPGWQRERRAKGNGFVREYLTFCVCYINNLIHQNIQKL